MLSTESVREMILKNYPASDEVRTKTPTNRENLTPGNPFQ